VVIRINSCGDGLPCKFFPLNHSLVDGVANVFFVLVYLSNQENLKQLNGLRLIGLIFGLDCTKKEKFFPQKEI
jgi:hypothetical protein